MAHALAQVGNLECAVLVGLQRVEWRAWVENEVLDPNQQVEERRKRGEDEDQPKQCVDDGKELWERPHRGAMRQRGLCGGERSRLGELGVHTRECSTRRQSGYLGVKAGLTLPSSVSGHMSPYPTVVTVTVRK